MDMTNIEFLYVRANLQKMLRKEGFTLIACVDRERVGALAAEIRKTDADTPRQYLYIDHLYVEPKQRSRGIGGHLTDAAIDAFKRLKHLEVMWLETVNQIAMHLYLKKGFVIIESNVENNWAYMEFRKDVAKP
jgi:ribosomal protein S18 acetylase RimI-like enzyme